MGLRVECLGFRVYRVLVGSYAVPLQGTTTPVGCLDQ